MARTVLWGIGLLGFIASGTIGWEHWMNPPSLDEIPDVGIAVAQSASVSTASVPTGQAVESIWNRPLRKPLYDPPPPAPPPPPPPPPTIPVMILGVMQEQGASYALLKVGSLNGELMKVGDKLNASGTMVEVIEIAADRVRVRIGTREVDVRRE